MYKFGESTFRSHGPVNIGSEITSFDVSLEICIGFTYRNLRLPTLSSLLYTSGTYISSFLIFYRIG